MNNSYCVYKHTNKNDHKVYIGMTNNIKRRWRNDGIEYRPATGRKSRFWNAIQKYGWHAFDHEILVSGLTKEEAEKQERHYIELYHSQDKSKGYNIAAGGNGGRIYAEHPKGMLGKHQSNYEKEVHRKMLLDKSRNPMTNGTVVWGVTHEHPKGMKGKHQSEKHKQAMARKRGYNSANHKSVVIVFPSGCQERFPSVTAVIKKYKLWQIRKMLDTGKPYELPMANMPNKSKYARFVGCYFYTEDTEVSH